MAVVEDIRLKWHEKIYISPILKGMGETLRHFFGPKVTLQYPDLKRQLPARFRGLPKLNKKENGLERCTACELCATVCPSGAITIVASETDDPGVEKYPLEYDIDALRCIYCGMCVEACPVDAISMTHLYDHVTYNREHAQYNKWRLLNLDDQPVKILSP